MKNIKAFLRYPKSSYTILALCLAGLVLSAYMYKVTLGIDDGGVVPCTPNGGCETVLSSSYSKILGMPIAFWGIVYYVGIGALVVLRKYLSNPAVHMLLKVGIAWGVIFTIYLRYLEHFVIQSYCSLCWVSVVIVALLVIVLGLERYPKSPTMN